ncbi:DUF1707 SHOCT-like domain-containing protein [Raineyella fluvialis]|nr:DUF1707 domain-containing protein [Raineyella fluvialis]
MTAGMPDHFRASDVDRARVTDLLDAAYADGRLTLEEHRDRVSRALAARTFADFGPLTADLGGAPFPPGGAVVPVVPGPGADAMVPADGTAYRGVGVPVDPSTQSPRDLVVAVFSGAERAGVHRVPKGTTAVAIFGGTTIDLRQAVFESRTITIDVVAMFGGVDVVVPDGVRVINKVFPIFGGASSKARCADPDAPTVILRGLAAFGGVSATLKRDDEQD